ncbi:PH domain-containing protein [Nocardioides limicola]|uniref:PH domain-containing protein n=1 Tax=Nocardioides limicola TaxID=2803368 RepID=UPI00193C5833|nr:PH domain-containing protein [Nocardioides sp. DJM-14]
MSTPTGLRVPAHQVSPAARPYWLLSAFISDLVLLSLLTVGYVVWPQPPWWAGTLLLILVLVLTVHVVAMPPIRFRVHRWEVTETAVHTRVGWLSTDERVAPISRVQTVDSHQTALMRLFGLATVTVTTASAAGPIVISCLDATVARQVVAWLTEITARTDGDAT